MPGSPLIECRPNQLFPLLHRRGYLRRSSARCEERDASLQRCRAGVGRKASRGIPFETSRRRLGRACPNQRPLRVGLDKLLQGTSPPPPPISSPLPTRTPPQPTTPHLLLSTL